MGTIIHMEKLTKKQKFARDMGKRIRQARKGMDPEREVTVQEMADQLGEKFSNYKKWDEGKATMPHHVIPKFCAVTRCDPWYLLTGQHGGFHPKPDPTPIPFPKRA